MNLNVSVSMMRLEPEKHGNCGIDFNKPPSSDNPMVNMKNRPNIMMMISNLLSLVSDLSD